ncbi:putative serine/threonine-protein phosphatase 2A regulatory subunit B'' subunit TON2 [Primulina tabacum]|uniref:putative serine/threonine-protein phosphatase 2A regulatory subunit B'' subunit TON2 n=1 Tax=Primulina tabacum TaxID=48773 RepID=UPI003F5A96F7
MLTMKMEKMWMQTLCLDVLNINLTFIIYLKTGYWSFFTLNFKVSLTQARIEMSELDEDSDGFLQPHEMESYMGGLISNLLQLWDMPGAFVQMYCRIAAHKFFFFCDPHERSYACIKKVLLSNCLQELMELHQESEEEVTDNEQAENWFSLTSAQRICDMFLAIDKDMNGTLSKPELRDYALQVGIYQQLEL